MSSGLVHPLLSAHERCMVGIGVMSVVEWMVGRRVRNDKGRGGGHGRQGRERRVSKVQTDKDRGWDELGRQGRLRNSRYSTIKLRIGVKYRISKLSFHWPGWSSGRTQLDLAVGRQVVTNPRSRS